MKKSTLRRLNATTTTEATASNLNRIMGKKDARIVATMDTDTEAATVAKFVKLALTEFKNQFEAATWLNVDTKAVRSNIKATTLGDIEATKSVTGTPDVRKLVSKAVAKAEAARRKAEARERKAAEAAANKATKAVAKAIEKAAEKAEKAASCWF